MVFPIFIHASSFVCCSNAPIRRGHSLPQPGMVPRKNAAFCIPAQPFARIYCHYECDRRRIRVSRCNDLDLTDYNWDKKIIHWAIEKKSTRMNEEYVKNVFTDAFTDWGKHTKKTFAQSPPGWKVCTPIELATQFTASRDT